MRSHGLRKLFVAVLLTLCVGAYSVEFSGRWDRTIQDANDEAGIVGVVLCIGVALFATGTLLSRIRSVRVVSRVVVAAPPLFQETLHGVLPTSINSPPSSLRI